MIKKQKVLTGQNSGRTAHRRNDRSLRGFTLVELMVVMAMTAIMIAVTLTSLSGAKDRKAVEGEARKMAATIREMQNYALTGKKFDIILPPTCWVGLWSVDVDDIQYLTYYRYRNVAGSSCADSTNVPVDHSLQTYSFQNGVTIRLATDPFGFSVPRGNLVDVSGNALASRQIQLKKVIDPSDSSKDIVYSVCIYSGGRVEEKAGSSC